MISVIIPVHNDAKYIKECILSVVNQSYKNIEIIVVNDHSSDNSIDIIKQINDNRIKIFNSNNYGVSYARNLGIKKAKGDYLCFLDADDYWNLKKLESQIEFIMKNNYEFIFSNYMFVNENGKNIKKTNVPKKMNYKKALKNTCIFTSTTMFNLKNLKKENIYMPYIKRGQDTATWWKILKKGYIAYSQDEVFAYYRVRKNSLSSNKLIALKRTWNIYKLQDINFFLRLYYFICYIINAIFRRI